MKSLTPIEVASLGDGVCDTYFITCRFRVITGRNFIFIFWGGGFSSVLQLLCAFVPDVLFIQLLTSEASPSPLTCVRVCVCVCCPCWRVVDGVCLNSTLMFLF